MGDEGMTEKKELNDYIVYFEGREISVQATGYTFEVSGSSIYVQFKGRNVLSAAFFGRDIGVSLLPKLEVC